MITVTHQSITKSSLQEIKKTKKSGEEDSDSESDRVSVSLQYSDLPYPYRKPCLIYCNSDTLPTCQWLILTSRLLDLEPLLYLPLLPLTECQEEEETRMEEQKEEIILLIRWLLHSAVDLVKEEEEGEVEQHPHHLLHLLLLLLHHLLQEEEDHLRLLVRLLYRSITVTHLPFRSPQEDSRQEAACEEGSGQTRNQEGEFHHQGRQRGQELCARGTVYCSHFSIDFPISP